MSQFLRRLRLLLHLQTKEDELREELEFHLQEERQELEAQGLSSEEARYASLRELGNISSIREQTRAVWTWSFVEQFVQDCRYGFRALAANKTFSLLAVLSLALGIGANTAIYSFLDWLLMRSLPVADPQSLVVLNWRALPGSGRDSVVKSMSGNVWRDDSGRRVSGIFPYKAFELIRGNSSTLFSDVFGYYPAGRLNVVVQGGAEIALGEFVSGNYFHALEVIPAAGRLIAPDDDRSTAAGIVVLSYEFSRRRFGDAASAPGQSILINNVAFTVAGVAPRGFFGVDPAVAPDFYIPIQANALLQLRAGPRLTERLNPNYYWLEMMARLKPGVSQMQAQASLAPLFHNWVEATAKNDKERSTLPELLLQPGAAGLDTLRRQYSKPLYVLLGMVGLILVIACVNIANLLLARASARRREIAVRLSLGAGRFRVIRQLLTESILLSTLGGVLGVVCAVWGIRFLTVLLANGNERFTMRPTLNWSVLAASAAMSLCTGLLFGLAPALQATRVDLQGVLKSTRTAQLAGRSRRWNLGQVLVPVQIGMSLVMLLAAGLFVRTLSNLQSIELGFNRENLLLFRIDAHQAGHRDTELLTFYRSLLERFAAIPGVSQAAAMHNPLLGQGTWSSPVTPSGRERRPELDTNLLMTSSNFFDAMQIPVLRGRAFEERDRSGSPPVAVVNEEYVKQNLAGREPLGQHLVIERRAPLKDQDVEVVGVVKNARYGRLKGEHRSVVYLPFDQNSYFPVEDLTFALRTSGDPLRHVNAVREIVRNADSRIPVTRITTQAAQIDQTMNQEIVFARLCTGFAALALIIACVGLYGTMAYVVERRTAEIGIRMAIGASRGNIVWLILRQVLVLAGAGLAIGVPVALVSSTLVKSFLVGVEPHDISTIFLSVAVLLASALLAGYVPAARAARVDPMTAVRTE